MNDVQKLADWNGGLFFTFPLWGGVGGEVKQQVEYVFKQTNMERQLSHFL